MRRERFKAEASVQVAHYNCVSWVVDRNFALGELAEHLKMERSAWRHRAAMNGRERPWVAALH